MLHYQCTLCSKIEKQFQKLILYSPDFGFENIPYHLEFEFCRALLDNKIRKQINKHSIFIIVFLSVEGVE